MSSAVLILVAGVAVLSCAPKIRSTSVAPLGPEQMAQMWIEPPTVQPRDLFYGIGRERLAPRPDVEYRVIEIKQGGFSRGLTATDPEGREWSVKFPPEAATEVVASRITWAVGYHQPPVYLLREWTAKGALDPNPQLPARFREAKPDLKGLDKIGEWSWHENPFVGTRPYAGLLVLMVMLGNSDLKPLNNAVYQLDEPVEGAQRWYVVRDLGHTFGRTGVVDAPRDDIEEFERTGFIRGVANGRVEFDYHGLHKELFAQVTPADVRWICERLSRLSDEQWHDAFRAGGYSTQTADRFIRRLKQKIAQGLDLGD